MKEENGWGKPTEQTNLFMFKSEITQNIPDISEKLTDTTVNLLIFDFVVWNILEQKLPTHSHLPTRPIAQQFRLWATDVTICSWAKKTNRLNDKADLFWQHATSWSFISSGCDSVESLTLFVFNKQGLCLLILNYTPNINLRHVGFV